MEKLKKLYAKIRLAIVLMKSKFIVTRQDLRTRQYHYAVYLPLVGKIYWTKNVRRASRFTFKATSKVMEIANSTNRSPVYKIDFKTTGELLNPQPKKK